MTKTIAILGATGNQGSGLTHALLSEPTTSNDEHPHPDLKIRALTRSTTSAAAQSLQKTYPDPARLVLVQADVYDADSLRAAFKDADAVFAMTNNRKSGGVIETEDEMKHELVQGRNIVDAAKVSIPSLHFPILHEEQELELGLVTKTHAPGMQNPPSNPKQPPRYLPRQPRPLHQGLPFRLQGAD